MNNEQKFPREQETLRLLLQKVSIAYESIWEAFETDFFSDAKSDVYEVVKSISMTLDLSPEVKQQLLPVAEKGWNAIINKTTGNGERVSKASSMMNELTNNINKILSL